MRVAVDAQEVENLFCDIWLQVDAIIQNGIEVVSSRDDGHRRFLRSNIEARADFVNGLFVALKRLGLRSVISSLRDKLRQRLSRDCSGYQNKVDVFAFSCVQEILFN